MSPKKSVTEELERLKGKGESFKTADELPQDPEEKGLQEEIEESVKSGQNPLETFKPTKDEEFDALDKMDEEQILAELKGDLVDKFFYEFQQWDAESRSKKTVVGISYAGTKQIVQAQGGFETMSINVTEGPEDFFAYVIVKNKKKDLTMPGGAQQPKTMTYKDYNSGEVKTRKDDKAVAKVVSKATRNAIRATIPEEVIKALYLKYKNGLKEKARQDSP